jgi:hypothetical protein
MLSMVAKTGLVVPVIGMSRKTGGSPIGRALKSCTIGVFTNGIDADFFYPFPRNNVIKKQATLIIKIACFL